MSCRRIRLRRFFFFLAIFIQINQVSCGGYALHSIDTASSAKLNDIYIDSAYATRYFSSGVGTHAEFDTHCTTEIKLNSPATSNFETTMDTFNSYYTRLQLKSFQDFQLNKDEEPQKGIFDVNAYLIMPKKFDSFYITSVRCDEEEQRGQAVIQFFYDGREYEFTQASDLIDGEEVDMYLQPYCPQFEGLDLDYQNTFIDNQYADGLQYEGTFSINAAKGG